MIVHVRKAGWSTRETKKKTAKFQILELVNGAKLVVTLGISFSGEIRALTIPARVSKNGCPFLPTLVNQGGSEPQGMCKFDSPFCSPFHHSSLCFSPAEHGCPYL